MIQLQVSELEAHCINFFKTKGKELKNGTLPKDVKLEACLWRGLKRTRMP